MCTAQFDYCKYPDTSDETKDFLCVKSSDELIDVFVAPNAATLPISSLLL